MRDEYVPTPVDRTKSGWVAKVLKEFGRPKTTVRALFYYAMQREDADYPICGGFVGEIRATRRYHESDGSRLAKWVDRAKLIGYIDSDAILDEQPEESEFFPGPRDKSPASTSQKKDVRHYNIELWLNKSTLNSLIKPVCKKIGITMVSVNGRPTEKSIKDLYARAEIPTIVLCLSDLSNNGFSFGRDLAMAIAKAGLPMQDIRVKRIGLSPRQVIDLDIPLISGKKVAKECQDRFKRYLKPFGLNPKKMAEIDALEVNYPGGIAGFVNEYLSKCLGTFDPEDMHWLLDLKKRVIPGNIDVDVTIERSGL
jgi:hypothetical protein